MTIGIDVRMIHPFPTGIGNYRENLIKALARCETKHRFVLVGKAGSKMEEWALNQRGFDFERIISPANSSLQHLALPIELLRLDLDAFWTTPWGATLLMPCPYFLTIYDLIYRRYPEYASFKARLYEQVLAGKIARNAELVFVTSEFVKDDVVSFLQVDKEKVVNIKGAAGPAYTVLGDSDYVKGVLDKYELQTPYFVYVGNMRPHKNLLALINAFGVLKSDPSYEDLDLVVIGSVDALGRDTDTVQLKELVTNLGVTDSVKFLGRIPKNSEVAAILNRAVALVHPSLHEGFGLTVLEAMQSGCPVVTSSQTSIPEIGADLAFYVDPNEQQNIVRGMSKVLGLGKDERQVLVTKCVEHAKQFSWEKVADKVLKIFDQFSSQCSN